MLEEHGLTLPPARFPLRGFDRNGQTGNWRRKALEDTRRKIRRRKAPGVGAGTVLTPWTLAAVEGLDVAIPVNTIERKSPGGAGKGLFLSWRSL